MSKKLFVSNINFEITEEDLKNMFEEVGATVSVVMARDKATDRPKGFAFVDMKNEEDGKKAIEVLNDKVIGGRRMKVAADRGKGGGAPSHGQGAQGGQGGGRKHEFLPPIQRVSLFRSGKKLDPFVEDPSKAIDYKDVALLSKFLSERGRILGRKFTGLSAYHQRQVKKAIKRAQHAGLLPFSNF